MDDNIIFNIIGYDAILINKVLTKYVLNDYYKNMNKLCHNLSSMVSTFLLQSHCNSEIYDIGCFLSLGPTIDNEIFIEIINHGKYASSIGISITYQTTKKNTEYHTFAHNENIQLSFQNILHTIIYSMIKVRKIDIDTDVYISLKMVNIGINLDNTYIIFKQHNYDYYVCSNKETPSSSNYIINCKPYNINIL